MEVFPCPLGILALRLCRSVAASKSFGHRGGDFGQLTNERINLFAPFAVPAEAEPDDRWERPQISSFPWSFLPVAWFLPDWRFPFLRLRLRSSSPWPPFILSLGRDVSGSAEPVLVLYAPGTEHLPRCSHMDAILRCGTIAVAPAIALAVLVG